MKKIILSALLLASSSAIAADPAVPLIPRETLFGNPTKAGGTLSPDGKWLSWMAPHERRAERLGRPGGRSRRGQAR